ncbi:MAG: purine-nucleoside phosphorylase, partial [Clostridia bacterium]|nr:purine-nucleoside phosphorylase [Clostridia bacterium]
MYLRFKQGFHPNCKLFGWNPFVVAKWQKIYTIPYCDIPGFPASNVAGHEARLTFGRVEGCEIVAMQGRFHFYEGFTMKQVAFPIFVLRELGVTDLIITNACGGIREDFRPGDLMLITDHINLLG